MSEPAPIDENVLMLPAAWLRSLHPRRGGTPVPAPRGSRAKEAAALIEGAAGALAGLPSDENVEPELRDAARRHLGGEPDAVGAAVVAAAVLAGENDDLDTDRRCRPFVDLWRAEHGLGFAACAALELGRLRLPVRDGGRVPVPNESSSLGVIGEETLRYVRRLLVAAADAEHADAVRCLAEHRTTAPRRRVASYLVPAEADWLEESAADPTNGYEDRLLKLHSINRVERLTDSLTLFHPDVERGLIGTLVDGCGADVLPILLASFDDRPSARAADILLEAVAMLPSDEAFAALVERADRDRVRPALLSMMERFPERAARILAATDTVRAMELLRIHVTARPELEELLPEGARAVLRGREEPPEADPASLPAPLCGLPWDEPVKPVVTGPEAPATRTIVWADGEREEWTLAGLDDFPVPDDVDWDDLETAFEKFQTTKRVALALYGAEEKVRPLLAGWAEDLAWPEGTHGRSLVARYEADALPFAHLMTKRAQAEHAALLVPFLDAEVAAAMGDWLARGTRGAAAARDWCDRHGLAAVPFAAPAALARPAARRRAAEAVLRRLAERHGADAVVDAVPGADPETAAALRAVLAAHPAATGLLRRPKHGLWADPAVLPRVFLRGRERALAPETTRTLIDLLAMPELDGMDVVERECDPESLAAFGLALLNGWLAAGMPADGGWALTRLARIGDDRAVEVLAPLIRTWPGKDRMHRAEQGLDVLVGIGTTAALAIVHELAVRWPGISLRKAAARAFGRAAAARGVSAGALGDRFVPDLGLDDDGAVTIDYGRRRFTARFDALLRPVVTDEDGVLRKSLPKPGKKDDPELAPAAYAEFTALRKRVADAASFQVLRLEAAMRSQRTWTPEDFRGYAVRDPLVRQIARRLVWLCADGGTAVAFRIAEDGTFADADDDVFEPSAAARIAVAHPVRLGAAAATWAGILADYELLQPFPQLDHPVQTLTEDDRAAALLDRFAGRDVRRSAVSELVGRDWFWVRNADRVDRFARRVGDAGHIVADFDRPEDDLVHYTIRSVRAVTEPGDAGTPVPFGAFDSAAVSDALTDLLVIAGTAS
ncbi:DUF4132 domain-containing protein [Actinomadura algeriensis]|uniref:DUF4132 domain-containing protein n=1 Tax=Actinomadura algeriensis TaxID=1679523 RepID=A0ABR9K304_9ACTN|nr:DUF4132 domain-containing protein [Actinomadura algeriensis]MBE1537236.1 hypothetical protein [Actinomadura algeriensis]